MRLKIVCLLLLGILFLLLLGEIAAISNNDIAVAEENLITEEERRGAAVEPPRNKKGDDQEPSKSEKTKRGLLSQETFGLHQTHYPSSGFSSGGAVAYPSYHSSYGGGHSGSGYLGSTTGHGYGFVSGHGFDGHSSSGHHGGGGGHHYNVGGHGHHGLNPLALKGLLIPLAGIALLGAAAALSTNPVLLQLGVVNGRRRKRSPYPREYPTKAFHALPSRYYNYTTR